MSEEVLRHSLLPNEGRRSLELGEVELEDGEVVARRMLLRVDRIRAGDRVVDIAELGGFRAYQAFLRSNRRLAEVLGRSDLNTSDLKTSDLNTSDLNTSDLDTWRPGRQRRERLRTGRPVEEITVGRERLLARLDALARISDDGAGVTRLAYSRQDFEARHVGGRLDDQACPASRSRWTRRRI